ncbi:MAG: hypothetical protein AAGA30_05855 [Planctomycetota bacterium]
MIDRASTFAESDIVQSLKTDFIAVAIDQWYTRYQEDAEGRFYQKIAKQGPRKNLKLTTQGMYVCDARGKLLGFCNHHRADLNRLREVLATSSAKFDSNIKAKPLSLNSVDEEYDRTPPEGSLTIRVHSKILGGYDEPANQEIKIFQDSIARDNLWILEDEIQGLLRGDFPDTLAYRIAQFHLLDNTRGEPLMWDIDELKLVRMSMSKTGVINGSVRIESKDGKRGYSAALRGQVKRKGNKLKSFNMVAKGLCFGDGPYTPHAPKGKFPLAVAFRMADGTDIADPVQPQGTKGWFHKYVSPVFTER